LGYREEPLFGPLRLVWTKKINRHHPWSRRTTLKNI
jgi:hypothetical protein